MDVRPSAPVRLANSMYPPGVGLAGPQDEVQDGARQALAVGATELADGLEITPPASGPRAEG